MSRASCCPARRSHRRGLAWAASAPPARTARLTTRATPGSVSLIWPATRSDRYARRRGGGEHGAGCLAGQRGRIEPSLAGDDQVRPGQRAVQARRVSSAAPGVRIAPARRRARHPLPGGAGARGSRVAAEQRGQPGQPRFQPVDLRAARALLQPEDGRRTTQAEQWRGDVGQAGHPAGRGRSQLAQIRPGQPGQRPAARGQRLARSVEEPGPERGPRPGAAVGRGGTAEPGQYPVSPGIQARPSTSPRPVVCAPIGSGRASRVSPLDRASCGYGCPARQFQPAGEVTGRLQARSPGRGAGGRPPGTAAAARVQGAFAAVGQRQPGHLVATTASHPAARALATTVALALPLNESGAISTRKLAA